MIPEREIGHDDMSEGGQQDGGPDRDPPGRMARHSPPREVDPPDGPAQVAASPAAREEAASAWLTRQINQLRAEHDALREELARVETELGQRSRRLHQLQGERDQLAALLAGRDAEILRLARELGARERPPPPRRDLWARVRQGWARATFAPQRWLGRAAATLRREAPPQKQPGASESEVPEPLLVPWVRQGPARPVLAAVLVGLDGAAIERVLEVVDHTCRERGSVPLLITDNDAFQLFRGRGAVVEFLPPRAEQERAAPDLDWQLYTQRRLALIRRKWQPTRIVAFGSLATAVVQLWQDSPFEETPLPAALRRRPDALETAGPD
jgi:hypothetical protein